MKLTIVYDTEVKKDGLKADWGFSCFIEEEHMPSILFDTGASGSILLRNMQKLGIDPKCIEIVVISHSHFDHVGGLADLLELNDDALLYLPVSIVEHVPPMTNVIPVTGPMQICSNVYTTGELMRIEQSLILNTGKGIVVIAGCSHPEVDSIFAAASKFGQIYGVVGGLHEFSDFELVSKLSLICPCHCTVHKQELKQAFPHSYIDCGAGLVLEL
jgi:7,8-dihydropterin-6-yl-methyl-4-(beta-D-ribofuranosyl)aminobenzene 5'-phosphate synthase